MKRSLKKILLTIFLFFTFFEGLHALAPQPEATRVYFIKKSLTLLEELKKELKSRVKDFQPYQGKEELQSPQQNILRRGRIKKRRSSVNWYALFPMGGGTLNPIQPISRSPIVRNEAIPKVYIQKDKPKRVENKAARYSKEALFFSSNNAVENLIVWLFEKIEGEQLTPQEIIPLMKTLNQREKLNPYLKGNPLYEEKKLEIQLLAQFFDEVLNLLDHFTMISLSHLKVLHHSA